MEINLDKCIIRSLKDDDAYSLARYADNHKIWINLRDAFPHPYTLEDGRSFIKKSLQNIPETNFAISVDDLAVGCIGIGLHRDVERLSAEIGYWLAEPFWGRGIMTNAVNRFTHYAFGTFELHRIFATPYVYNKASIRVLMKSGFTNEGRLQASAFKDNKIVDQFIFAKLKEGLTNLEVSERIKE